MKKIISIAFAAILAGLVISCQKENSFSVNTTDSVQYSFNITVNEQFGFDGDVSTKVGVSPSYKTAWANGDRIFLFFKPTSGSLLTNTYATLTYDGSTWGGAVTGTSSLGDGGKLSAVYVYNLDGSVTPEFSTDKWTVATGNVFYNCQADVSYTVSGDEITASLNLVAPTDFVRFSVAGASGPLTCDKVNGWKDIAIGSDLAVSNVTNTGYMDVNANVGDSSVKDYYGRLVSGTSLKDVACKFSVVNNGKVYEHTAAPTSNARSFQMSTSAWAEAPGKLPGLFSVAADGKVIRFSKGNLRYTTENSTWSFFDNQYDYGHSNDQVSLFTWGYGTWSTTPYTTSSLSGHTTTGEIISQSEDWGSTIDSEGTWRTLTTAEWQYLFNYDSRAYGGTDYRNATRAGLYAVMVKVVDKANCVILYPDGYAGTKVSDGDTTSYDKVVEWAAAQNAGAVCLPAAGWYYNSYPYGAYVKDEGSSVIYWSSSAAGTQASRVNITTSDFYPWYNGNRITGCSVRLVSNAN